jgi:hypothetical protein
MAAILFAFIIISSLILLFVLSIVLSRLREIHRQKKRTRQILHIIDGKSFMFHRKHQVGCYDLLADVHEKLRSAGIKNLCFTFQNVLTCKRKGVKWLIFDAGYGKRLGKNSRFIATYFQAEVAEDLPRFSATPVKGNPPTDRFVFKNHAFMQRYAVRGDDKDAQKIFTPLLQKILLELPVPFSIQAADHLLQFHVAIQDAPPEKILELFSSAEKICTVLQQQSP